LLDAIDQHLGHVGVWKHQAPPGKRPSGELRQPLDDKGTELRVLVADLPRFLVLIRWWRETHRSLGGPRRTTPWRSVSIHNQCKARYERL
jgi:hypothetical protein